MTETEARAKLISWLESQIGTVEEGENINPYAQIAKQMYGWDPQGQPWCDVFVDAAFIDVFGYDKACALTYQYSGCSGAACRYSAQYYKDHGAWYTEPKVGDQIFFYVASGINHTGIVVDTDAWTLRAVEGNTSDRVAKREYRKSDITIAGYGRPDWDIFREAGEEPEETAEDTGVVVVKTGDTLWAIAEKYLGSGFLYKDLMKWNGMKSTNIRPGQVLKLQQEEEPAEEMNVTGTEAAPAANGERYYTVQRGDSLWAIASKCYGDGLRYVNIMSANGLKGTTIQPGDVLKIP